MSAPVIRPLENGIIPKTSWLDNALVLPPDQIARFIDPASGIRFYPVPNPTGEYLVAFPGATSLLGFVAPQQTKDTLNRWRAKEVAAGRDPSAAANTGTLVHSCMERIVRGEDPAPDNEDVAILLEGMPEGLSEYTSFIWNEAPLRSEHFFTYNTTDLTHPDRLPRVWSYRLGCSGTPDLLGRRRGRICLGDFKTSKRPYVQAGAGEVVKYGDGLGYKSYKKTVRQLICYAFCIEETLGITVDDFQIIVGLRDGHQILEVPEWEIAMERWSVLSMAQRFWNAYGELKMSELKQLEATPSGVTTLEVTPLEEAPVLV